MDRQRMVEAARFTRLAVTLTFDPSAEDGERAVAGVHWV